MIIDYRKYPSEQDIKIVVWLNENIGSHGHGWYWTYNHSLYIDDESNGIAFLLNWA